MVSSTPRPHFTPGKDPVPIAQGAGWAPGPVWTGTENLAPTGIRSPERPVTIPTELPRPASYSGTTEKLQKVGRITATFKFYKKKEIKVGRITATFEFYKKKK